MKFVVDFLLLYLSVLLWNISPYERDKVNQIYQQFDYYSYMTLSKDYYSK